MQGALLVLCLFYKARQAKLGIDDFGAPLSSSASTAASPQPTVPAPTQQSQHPKAPEPLQAGVPVTAGPSTPGVGVTDALHAALAKDVRVPATPAVRAVSSSSNPAASSTERAPLLPAAGVNKDDGASKKTWWNSLVGR
jgi:cytoskeletal protein RodZ